jgi:outer membrane protein assembly factor BamD (BamD/ComL family)
MEVRAHLLRAYAGVAFARQEYPRARSQYERIAVAREFESTQGALLAEIKIADIDRIAKRYDAAIERLEKLRRRSDPVLQAESNYQLAMIKFEQDDIAAARDFVNQVFALNMNHANARILEGNLNLKMKKLIEATQVTVGMATDRMTIIPGRPLKVQIDDRNLNVVGRMANIEVRVWTASGDEEFFRLLPFGDSKTKFEGEMQTALAPLVKGDHTLQVLGRDKVNYCFSDQFKRSAGITNDTVTTIDVISDAELFISSGRILTREEQEELELQRQLLVIDKTAEEGRTLSSVRANNEIKPGNPISVRVVDPDRSTTAGKDQIKVRVVTSSGDSVDGAVLTETDTHSGVFEGKIQTASSAATAFASDSEEGNEPAFAISSSNYPPWVALADNRRPKSFTVDLNNNLMLGRLNILADVPGRRLKRLSVQTSMNGKDFTTLATWPEAMPDWDGYLRCRLVKYSLPGGRPASVSAFKQYLGSDYMVEGNEMVYLPGMLSGKIGADMLGQNARLNLAQSGEGSRYIAHLQGVFYASERRTRTFRVETKSKRTDVTYILALDGKTGDRAKPHEVTILLEKGLHQFDLYIAAERRSEPEFELQYDIPEDPFMARCPTAMFMPINRPKNAPPFVSQIAKITTDSASNTFSVAFATNTAARLIRIGLADFEGDAPAIRRLSLVSAGGSQVLPTKDDILMLRRNQTLEIVPGDRLSVIYQDPSFVTKEKKVLEAFMNATFYNAKITAAFVESGIDGRGRREARYIPMRRFRAGDAISVLITDSDGDISDDQDKLKFKARLVRGKSIELEALESSAHSGVFIGRFFPVSGEPQRPSELKIEDGDDVVLSYMDEQNTDFGIPWQRTCQVEQTAPSTPELRVYNYTSRFLDAEELKANVDKPDVITGETMPVVRSLTAIRPGTMDSGRVSTNFIGCPVIAEVVYPTIALSPLSTCVIYVQRDPAVKPAGQDTTNAFDAALPSTNAFDSTLPGTLKYEFATGNAGAVSPPPGYQSVMVRGNTNDLEPLDDGRFTFVIPMQLGEGADSAETADPEKNQQTAVISTSYVDEEGRMAYLSRTVPRPTLYIRPDDEITVAYEIPGETNQASRWLTQRIVLSANAFFDVMDQRYQEPLRTLYVGERVYLRIVDPLRDTTSQKDSITVKIPVAGGSLTQSLALVETFAHSGTFKGSFLATYSGTSSNALPPDVVPVNYGETLSMSYQAAVGGLPMIRTVQIRQGADGTVLPFTKRFAEPEVAVQTQFTIAEAYFELAKKHRELKQEDLARLEIAQGKKLLEEAIRDYPETEERAHADYLLANLSLEYAEELQDPEAKKKRYMEAVTRFSDLVSNYSGSPYAPKSQFKKALAFEKLGELEQACEEYVKLSYRYPDNELVAETIARLGQYFMVRGKEWQDKANAETDIVKKEKARRQMLDMFKTAAQVFSRLSVRFPDHQLAGKTIVLSAQCWIRAEELDQAIAVFGSVIEAKKASSDLIAQSMYWSGDCYIKKKDFVNAYRMLKKLTWDYPETTWAKYARGRLSEAALASIEANEEK